MAAYGGLSPWIINIVSYAIILGGPFLWGNFGNGMSPDDMGPRYQTLITPAGAAFAIWGIIYTWEAVFVLAQALPSNRDKQLVAVITPWLLACAVFTNVWTVAFSLESFAISQVGMSGIWISLVGIILQTDALKGITTAEYWLIRAPFSLHGGWVTVAHFLNLNVWADSLQAPAPQLVAIAIASLCAVFGLIVLFAVAVPRPDPIMPVAAAWAAGWIYSSLQDPTRFLSKTNNPVSLDLATLEGFSRAASYLSLLFLTLAVVAVPLRLRSWRDVDADAKGNVEMGGEPLQAAFGA